MKKFIDSKIGFCITWFVFSATTFISFIVITNSQKSNVEYVKTKAYNFGAESRRGGATSDSNPYDTGTYSRKEWLRGWIDENNKGK